LLLLIQTNISFKNKHNLFLLPRNFVLNKILKFFHRFTCLFICIICCFSRPKLIFFTAVALALAEVAPSVVHRDTGVAPSSVRAQKCSAAVFGISESKCQAFSSLVFHLILRDLGYRLNCGVKVCLFRFGSLSKQKYNFLYKCLIRKSLARVT